MVHFIDAISKMNEGIMYRFATLLALTAALSGVPACSSPADTGNPDPDLPPVRNLTWTGAETAEQQGVFVRIGLWVLVRDSTGALLPDVPVEWRVTDGGGDFAGSAELTSTSDADGMASITWTLGPKVGMQEVEVGTSGADPLSVQVEATPGVVLVGVWHLDEENQAALPSDTMRIHASENLKVARAIETFEDEDEGSLGLHGWPRAGAGIDDRWLFHLDPYTASANSVGMPVTSNCMSSPPLTEEEVEAVLAADQRLCPADIRLVAIEEVPQEYLDGLLSGG